MMQRALLLTLLLLTTLACGSEGVSVLLTPAAEVTLSAEIEGRVLAMPKEVGERFEAGELLCTLDTGVPSLEIAHAEALLAEARARQVRAKIMKEEAIEIRRAEAEQLAAEAQLARAAELFKAKQASTAELELARRDLALAVAGVARARLSTEAEWSGATRDIALAEVSLAQAQRRLAACKVFAPFAGRVAERHLAPHEMARALQPLLTLHADTTLRARCLAPSGALATLRIGDRLTLSLRERPGETFTATIREIGAAIDPASRTLEIFAELPNPAHHLLPGMTGSGELLQRDTPEGTP